MLYSIKPNKSDIKFVLNNLRVEDKLEMLFEFGENWKSIIFNSAINSDIKLIVDDNNSPVGFYGIRKLENNTAEISLLVTDNIKKNHTAFLLQAKKVIEKWLKKYSKLENYIYKHNKNAIKWLQWLGFTLIDADKNRMYFYRCNHD